MQDPSDRCVRDDGSVQIGCKFDPIYFELGRNVVSLTRQEDPVLRAVERPAQSYYFTNLTNPGGSLSIPSSLDTRQAKDLIIGREATPELRLDDTASRRHFSIVTMVTGIKLKDLHALNGTIVHTRNAVTFFNRPVNSRLQSR